MVPFSQVMRSLVPAIVMVIGINMFSKKFSRARKVNEPRAAGARIECPVFTKKQRSRPDNSLFFLRVIQMYRGGGGDVTNVSQISSFGQERGGNEREGEEA